MSDCPDTLIPVTDDSRAVPCRPARYRPAGSDSIQRSAKLKARSFTPGGQAVVCGHSPRAAFLWRTLDVLASLRSHAPLVRQTSLGMLRQRVIGSCIAEQCFSGIRIGHEGREFASLFGAGTPMICIVQERRHSLPAKSQSDLNQPNRRCFVSHGPRFAWDQNLWHHGFIFSPARPIGATCRPRPD
jgi:hypothetical protein